MSQRGVRPRRHPALRLLTVLVSLGVGGLLAEAGLRVFVERPAPGPQQHRLFCEYDPVLGWRKRASFAGEIVTREYRVTEEFNSKGLRGPERSYDRPAAGTLRVLVLGDSSAEGYAVGYPQLFSRLLEIDLARRTGREVEVINAGTGGYSTDQELLFFEREGQKYRPDVTLLLFHDNDVWFNGQDRYWRAFKPRFLLESGALRLTNVPPPASPPSPVGVRRSEGAGQRVKSWLLAHSRLAGLLRDGLHQVPAIHRLMIAAGISGPGRTAGTYPLPEEWTVYRRDEPPAVRAAWQVTEALLGRLAGDAAAAGSAFLVFHVPIAEAIYPDRRDAQLRAFGLDPAAWDLGRPLAELEAICARRGIALVDPAGFDEAAAAVERQGRRLYYRVDMHWNPAGHRAAADVLAEPLAGALISAAAPP